MFSLQRHIFCQISKSLATTTLTKISPPPQKKIAQKSKGISQKIIFVRYTTKNTTTNSHLQIHTLIHARIQSKMNKGAPNKKNINAN